MNAWNQSLAVMLFIFSSTIYLFFSQNWMVKDVNYMTAPRPKPKAPKGPTPISINIPNKAVHDKPKAPKGPTPISINIPNKAVHDKPKAPKGPTPISINIPNTAVHDKPKAPKGPTRVSSNIPNIAARNSKIVVPKKVHYLWIYSRKDCFFKFHYFMSFLSAYKYIKPEEIIIWYENLPCGKWWNETKSRIPILKLIHRLSPQTVFGQPIRVPEHKADVARLDILLKHGGIYLDLDMIALKSWDPLLYYNTTLGAETDYDLANGVIISIKNASFLRIWKDSYHDFRDKHWGWNSVVMAYRLAKLHPALVHVEWNTLIHPNFLNTKWLLEKNKLWDWSDVYGMHLYYRHYKPQHNPQDIKLLNSTLGEVFRFIYYNTTHIIH